jgi:hypothetical protein
MTVRYPARSDVTFSHHLLAPTRARFGPLATVENATSTGKSSSSETISVDRMMVASSRVVSSRAKWRLPISGSVAAISAGTRGASLTGCGAAALQDLLGVVVRPSG